MNEPSVYVMRQWLRDVVEAEKGYLVVDDAIACLQAQKTNLNKKVNASRLARSKQLAPSSPDYSKYGIGAVLTEGFSNAFFLAFGATIVVVVVSLGQYIGNHGSYDGTTPVSSFMQRIYDYTGYNMILTFILLYLLIFAILTIIFSIIAVFNVGKKRRAATEKYRESLASLPQAQKAEDDRVRSLKLEGEYISTTVMPRLETQLSEFNTLRANLRRTRERLYATHYLAPEYCSLAPVAVMLGYLESGRCNTVYGHGGIVDTYVHDQQFAILNGKLDTIIDMLDDIKSTQRELYRALDETRRTQAALRNDINRASQVAHADSSALLECERYNARMLTYISNIETYRMFTR